MRGIFRTLHFSRIFRSSTWTPVPDSTAKNKRTEVRLICAHIQLAGARSGQNRVLVAEQHHDAAGGEIREIPGGRLPGR